MKKEFVNSKNARRGEYKKIIEEIRLTGRCPFCKENFKYHQKPVFKRRGGWFLADNTWPYKNAACHLIIIGDQHKEDLSQLTQKDLAAVRYLACWAIKKFKIKGGSLVARFGDIDYNGASVAHLHFHLISPKFDKKRKRVKTVNFPIG